VIRRVGRPERLARLLRAFPVVGLLGPRQVGKTTPARARARRQAGPAAYVDLEHPADLARPVSPTTIGIAPGWTRRCMPTPRTGCRIWF
jgi:hypothetical protein